MHMKTGKLKPLLSVGAVVLGVLSGSDAQAQSSVTLYGLIDTGVEYLTNANKTSHALFQASSGNIQASRWGIKGVEDIGGGYQTVFVLESGFTPSTGVLA